MYFEMLVTFISFRKYTDYHFRKRMDDIMKSNFNAQCITYSQMSLIFNARTYFRRLITWTRTYLISRYLGIGTAEELFGRLYLEALDLGNMLNILFGRETANRDGQLSGQYAIIMRELISAQLEGNTEDINKHVAELYQNAADRAAFAAEVNPYWNKDELTELYNRFIQFTIAEANALVTGNYQVDPYERFTALTEELGDFIAQGLYEYITSGSECTAGIPSRCGQCVTNEQLNTIYHIKMFWYELASLVRNYMISRYKGLGEPAEEFFYNALSQVALNYVNELSAIFGDEVTEDYLQLLYRYFELIDPFITAQMEGNEDEINRITQLLYQYADASASFLVSVNPFWDQAEWENRLHNNIRSTINESTTFLTGDDSRNIDIFNTLLNQAEGTGDYFVQGLLKYIDQQCLES
jgi:hypothetical protein